MKGSALYCGLVLLTALLIAPRTSSAQVMTATGVGTRVRVRTAEPGRSTWYTGRVLAVNSDSITLGLERPDDVRRFAVANITDFGISRGRRSNARRGMLYGLVGGAAIGSVWAAATYEKGSGKCSFFYCTPDYRSAKGMKADAGAIVGALGGLVAGGIIGRFYHTEKWTRRPVR